MNNDDDIKKAKEKIRALREKKVEKGCTEAEAHAAMEKAAEILAKYNLDMKDVDFDEMELVERSYDTKSGMATVSVKTGVSISELTSTIVWKERNSQNNWEIVYFGFEKDVEMAIYLSEIVDNSFDTEIDEFRKGEVWANYPGHKKRLLGSFKNGFANKVNQRLQELKTKRDNEEADSNHYHQSNGNDLVSVAKENYAKEKFNELSVSKNIKKNYQKAKVTNANAFRDGNTAGNNVNLNRPVNKDKGQLLLA